MILFKKIFLIIFLLILTIFIDNIFSTIDLNSAELLYIANNLTPEECRKLIAAMHFKSFDLPKAAEQAERKIPKDITCLEHLHHWNSLPGEGKGETHELLEERLRQIGKIELANWVGKTVFHQLSVDLNNAINDSLHELLTPSTEEEFNETVTLDSLVPKIEDPTNFNNIDYLLFALTIGLILTIIGLCLKIICVKLKEKFKQRKLHKYKAYDLVESDYSSGTENEESKFDVRTYFASTSRNRN